MRNIMIIISILFCTNSIQAQYKIKHASGTASVNGTSVTVTSNGVVNGIANWVCVNPENIYHLGVNSNPFAWASGSYTFTFNPAVKKLKLNIIGINDSEVVKLFVNNQHFINTTTGTPNCKPMTLINADGDLAGTNVVVNGFSVGHGSDSIMLSGPITSLTVLDSISSLWYYTAGVGFSLHIIDFPLGVQTQTLPNSISVYPNPATSILNIELKINKWDNEFKIVELYNSIGQLIISSPLERGLSGELKARLNSSSLPKGLYYIKVGNATKKVMID
jgi:hypothetical protein